MKATLTVSGRKRETKIVTSARINREMMPRWLSYFLLLGIIASGCNTGTSYHQNLTIEKNIWDRTDVKTFTVPVTDTLNAFDIYLQIRNADGYPFSNLYLFINTKMPNGIERTDTVECILADHTGRWLGDGLGDIWDNSILYRKAIRFPVSGNYVFTIRHGMRQEKLPMIMDVGLAIRNQSGK